MARLLLSLTLSFGCGNISRENACSNARCSGHGTCVEVGSSAQCECDPGYVDVGLSCVPEADAGTDSDVDTDADTDTDCRDVDKDGHTAVACGGDDCDDSDPASYPGAADNAGVGEWVIETIASAGDTGEYPALATDDAGTLHATFFDVDAEIVRHASRTGDGWSVDDVFDASALTVDAVGTAVTVDPSGIPHVLLANNDVGARHAIPSGATWDVEPIDLGGAYRMSANLRILAGADGVLHAMMLRNDQVTYARGEAGDWSLQFVEEGDPQGFASFALGPGDALHACWRNNFNGSLVCAEKDGTWSTDPAVDPADAFDVSIAVDADDVVHGAYTDFGDDSLRFVRGTPGSWDGDVIDANVTTEAFPSVALDADGVMHVAYSNGVDFVHVAEDGGGGWTQEIFDSGGAGRSALAVLPGGIHVVYRDGGLGDLLYATRPAPDGRDQDCDGVDGVDGDGDGHASIETGGDDCDDDDAGRFAGC